MLTDGLSNFSTTAVARPDDMSAVHEQETTASASLDDIFGGDSDDEDGTQSRLISQITGSGHRNQDISEVPRLQSTHTTNGYREGVSTGKEKFLQEGFDEGYSLGAEIGAAAGRLVGILEALEVSVLAVAAQVEVAKQLEDARRDLSVKSLYAPEYFGAEDGIWKYRISDDEERDEDLTFRVVAGRHPLIVRWTAVVDGLLREYSLTPISD